MVKLLKEILQNMCMFLQVGSDQYGIFRADADTDIREWENSDIQYIGRYCI